LPRDSKLSAEKHQKANRAQEFKHLRDQRN